MTGDQVALLAILGVTVGAFVAGRWRPDIVALLALLACVAVGVVPAEAAFGGFGHPAVVTVAAVLVMSHGLRASGAVDAVLRRALPSSAGPWATMAILAVLGAALSAFMNNVGALALLLPVGLQLARKHGLPPGRVLLPLSFGSILGGMTTMIGTPPNLIVAGFRAETGAGAFGMFDFTPVGLAVTVVGLAFLVLIGWRWVPVRAPADAEAFDTGRYLTEVRVGSQSRAVGLSLRELEQEIDEGDAQIVSMVRHGTRLTAPNPARLVREGDVLVLEAEPGALGSVLSGLGLRLEEAVEPDADADRADTPNPATASVAVAAQAEDGAALEGNPEEDGAPSEEESAVDTGDVAIQEFVVMPQAAILGRSATDLQLRTRLGINLLAISRRGQRSVHRLRATRLRAGDVLLLQGARSALAGFAGEAGAVPLAERDIVVPDARRAAFAGTGMALAVAAAAFGLVPAAVAFVAGAVAFVLLRVVPPRDVYRAVDWPVVVLLAALLPVADAMATTGTADWLASGLLDGLAFGRPVVALALILVVTMTLSDFMNNAATAAVMCPIAIGAAASLGASPDAFLMAVAVGGSCAFLTPIGHQNNTLILGPGGFRFGDYWRVGLPLEVIVVAVAVPMLLWAWPL